MASKKDEGGCVTLTWAIQNLGLLLSLEEASHCSTPFWKTEHTRKMIWRRLLLYLSDCNIFVLLSPATSCLKIDRCEVSLISSCMEVPLDPRGQGYSGFMSYTVKKDAVFGHKRQSILPNDTLTLRCKMWEKTMKTLDFRINSVLHSFSYLWNIENFRPDNTYSKYIAKENFLFKAVLESESKKGNHNIILDDVCSMEHCVSLINGNISNKDGGVKVIRKIFDKYNVVAYETKICLNSTSLDLQLKSAFAVHKVCQDPFKLHSPPCYENVSEEVSGSLGDNLLLLYRDQLFSDATLNAEGKSFRVHRSILSARSPVFRAMFEKDELSEGRERVVDIDDVGSETVDRMLVYLYGDSLRSVQQWEEVSALYYAADKYDIQPLKHKCASSLKEGLTVDNACDALVLANRHSDDQLLKCIVDFIRQNDEVMSSEKWDSFENNNPLLSSKILRDIYVKKRKK